MADTLTLQLDTHLLPAWHFRYDYTASPFVFNTDSALVHRDADMIARKNHLIPGLRPSIFRGSEYKTVSGIPQTSPSSPLVKNFTGGILFLVFVLIVVIRLSNSKKIISYLSGLVSLKQFGKFLDQEEAGWLPPMPLTLIVASMIIGATAADVFVPRDLLSDKWYFILFSSLVTLAAFVLPVLKATGAQLVGSILKITPYTSVHANFSYTGQVLYSILLLPLFFTYALGGEWLAEWGFHYMAVTYGVLLVYHFIRMGIYISSEGAFPFFNFILYFCTLEILPLLLLYKLLIMYYSNVV